MQTLRQQILEEFDKLGITFSSGVNRTICKQFVGSALDKQMEEVKKIIEDIEIPEFPVEHADSSVVGHKNTNNLNDNLQFGARYGYKCAKEDFIQALTKE